jgi:hypothetical protein
MRGLGSDSHGRGLSSLMQVKEGGTCDRGLQLDQSFQGKRAAQAPGVSTKTLEFPVQGGIGRSAI